MECEGGVKRWGDAKTRKKTARAMGAGEQGERLRAPNFANQRLWGWAPR